MHFSFTVIIWDLVTGGPGHFPWGVNQNKMKQPFTILRDKFDLSHHNHCTTSKYIFTHNGKHSWDQLVQYQVALFGIQALRVDKKLHNPYHIQKKKIKKYPFKTFLKWKNNLLNVVCQYRLYIKKNSTTHNMWREGTDCNRMSEHATFKDRPIERVDRNTGLLF